ncbi:hypothetical protein Mapa_012011 [Marchantia paleacea]|nr:hypothetical protein Mapa_012011 [Marchantia paleacea]
MELPGDTPAEMRRFHRKHGVTELMTRLNTHKVPEYYVKPVSERRIVEADEDSEQIPCINLQAPSSEDLLTAVAGACKEWGFFYLINHGVPVSHLQDMQRCTREFFSLPHQEKLKINTPAGNAGPVHFGGGGNRDWREVLRIHFAPISESDKDYWPSKPVGFRFAPRASLSLAQRAQFFNYFF